MVELDDSLGEFFLENIWMFSGFESFSILSNFLKCRGGTELEVGYDEIITDTDELLIHTLGSLIDSDRIGTRLRHLLPI